MTFTPFDFTVEASHADEFAALLRDVTTGLLTLGGVSQPAADDLTAQAAAVLTAAGVGSCTVTVSARPASVTVTVSCPGHPATRLSHHLA